MTHCKTCHGRGYVSGDPEGAPIEDCPDCDGKRTLRICELCADPEACLNAKVCPEHGCDL